jgi:hypothetical protein
MEQAGSKASEAREPTDPERLPFERTRRLVPAMVICLLAVALFLGFLIESLRADQLTLSFEIAGLPVGDTEITHNHGRLIRDCTILTLLATAIALMWLIWQYRAHANLKVLAPGTRFHPVVGAALWFVPGVNLVGPPLAMREIWRASDLDHEDWRRSWTTPLLWVWWLLLLTALALGWWALAAASHDQPTLQQLALRDRRGVIAGGVGILAAVLTAVLIVVFNMRLTSREDVVRVGRWRGWEDRRR